MASIKDGKYLAEQFVEEHRAPFSKISSLFSDLPESHIFRLQQLAEGLMPVPAHRHRETFSHLIGSYGYILYGRVANPLYIDVHLVAHGLVSVLRKSLVSLVA